MGFILIYICEKCEKHLRTDYPTGEIASPNVPSHCGIPALVYERLGCVVMRHREYDWQAHILGSPKLVAFGQTRAEAIGMLWLNYPNLFAGPTQELIAKAQRGDVIL